MENFDFRLIPFFSPYHDKLLKHLASCSSVDLGRGNFLN